MSETSPADIAAVMRDTGEGWGDGSGIWAIVLVIIALMFGGGWGSRGQDAVTQADLCTTSNFTQLENSVGRISDQQASIARQGDNAFSTLGYAMQSGFSDVNSRISELAASTTAQVQEVKDLIQVNKIEALQQQVNELQLQAATSNIPRYPSGFTYNAGGNPFCACGYGAAF